MVRVFKSAESGRSMIEAIGYISVMIMIGVAAASAVNSGYYKFRLGRVTQQVTDLQKIISQRWVAAPGYPTKKGEMWKTLVSEKLVPWDLRSGDTSGKHAFAGTVEIGGDKAFNSQDAETDEDTAEAYYITFTGLPPDACTELGLKLWIVNNGSDLDSIQVNNTLWCWPASVSSKCNNNHKILPVKASDLKCNANWNNTITWVFN